jgi:hypothetical protein
MGKLDPVVEVVGDTVGDTVGNIVGDVPLFCVTILIVPNMLSKGIHSSSKAFLWPGIYLQLMMVMHSRTKEAC